VIRRLFHRTAMDDETIYWEETVVKTFFHFTLVRCSTVTRCKSSPPSLWSEPSASSSYYTKTRYCQLHGRRCSANSQFSQDRLLRLLMPENRFQLGKRFARSEMALFPAKIGDHDSSQGNPSFLLVERVHVWLQHPATSWIRC